MKLTFAKRGKPTPPSVADDPRWARIVAREKSADGHFWYSVATTGIYCKPSCASRTANPKNVQLHDSLQDAKATGYRPCKRCNPDGLPNDTANAGLVAKACRVIEARAEEPSLEELGDLIGLSPSHFHRVFKAMTGLTPKGYAAAHRARKVREHLVSGNSVTEAMYDAGFNSSGRFYEKSMSMLGMTPSRYRAGGANEEIKLAVGQTFLGAILVASSKKGVVAILLGDDPDALVRDLQDRLPRAQFVGADHEYEALVARVVGFVERPEIGLNLPLDVRGTAFQQRVWQALQEIPIGATVSYAEIAKRIGSPRSVRAVAGACAANKLAVAIPCHRVIRNDGALSGYAWGIERKCALLDRETCQLLKRCHDLLLFSIEEDHQTPGKNRISSPQTLEQMLLRPPGPILPCLQELARARPGREDSNLDMANWKPAALACPRGHAELHFIGIHKQLETLEFREPYRIRRVQSSGEN